MLCFITQPCPPLCDPTDCSPPGSSLHGILQARTLEWVAMPSLQRIFQTQGSDPGLLHCRQILYHLSHREAKSWAKRNPFLWLVWVFLCLLSCMDNQNSPSRHAHWALEWHIFAVYVHITSWQVRLRQSWVWLPCREVTGKHCQDWAAIRPESRTWWFLLVETLSKTEPVSKLSQWRTKNAEGSGRKQASSHPEISGIGIEIFIKGVDCCY